MLHSFVKDFLNKFYKLVNNAESVVIIGHLQPDADSIASSLLMCKYISSKFPLKNVVIAFESRNNTDWPFGDLNHQITWTEDVAEIANSKDLVIFLDGNQYSRFSRNPDKFKLKNTVCIDHHAGVTEQYTLDYVDTNVSSVAELLFNLFWDIELPTAWLDEYYAKIGIFGILSDTGSFRFVYETGVKVFKTVYEVCSTFKISMNELTNYLNTFKQEQVEFLAILLSRTVYVKDQEVKPYTYTYFNSADTKKFSIDATKSAAAQYRYMYLKQVEGYDWGFIITQTNQQDIDISFRSQPGSYDVKRIAERLNGGGHTQSAAAHIPASSVNSFDDVVKLIIQTVKDIYHAN